jgi:hypothetical protein
MKSAEELKNRSRTMMFTDSTKPFSVFGRVGVIVWIVIDTHANREAEHSRGNLSSDCCDRFHLASDKKR